LGTSNASKPRAHPWRRGKRRHRSPGLLRYGSIALAALLAVALAWRGVRWTLHPENLPDARMAASYSPIPSDASSAPDANTPGWQRDFHEAIDSATQDVDSGQIGAGEVAIDRAETILTTERLISADAPPEFFPSALGALDRLLAKGPDDSRLVEHIALARISLAELRSALAPEPAQPADEKRVAVGVPRAVAAGETLDAASIGGRIVDASLMPGSSEILLPPPSRAFADHVSVQNLIFEGAAQTLDGIHWHNVTFVGTRLRYDGGELNLQDVQFVRCRFGFKTDDRGSRLATAIAEGRNTIAIE
jgi:hypothetical protein